MNNSGQYQNYDTVFFQTLYSALKKLGPLDEETWRECRKCFFQKYYDKNSYFIQVGENSRYFGYVFSGTLKIFYILPDGKEKIKSFSIEGNFLAAYADLINNTASRVYIQALEPSVLLMANYDRLKRFSSKYPDLLQIFLKVAEWNYINKDQRERDFLTKCIDVRYKEFSDEWGCRLSVLGGKNSASYLGVTPETLSRLKKRSTRPSIQL